MPFLKRQLNPPSQSLSDEHSVKQAVIFGVGVAVGPGVEVGVGVPVIVPVGVGVPVIVSVGVGVGVISQTLP